MHDCAMTHHQTLSITRAEATGTIRNTDVRPRAATTTGRKNRSKPQSRTELFRRYHARGQLGILGLLLALLGSRRGRQNDRHVYHGAGNANPWTLPVEEQQLRSFDVPGDETAGDTVALGGRSHRPSVLRWPASARGASMDHRRIDGRGGPPDGRVA